MKNSRLQRVGDLIQTALAEILLREREAFHFGLITITKVIVSPDLSHAKVLVSVLDEEQAPEAIAALNEVSKDFRYELAHAVKMRITPELKFIYDDSIVRGNRISSLIDRALKENKSNDE